MINYNKLGEQLANDFKENKGRLGVCISYRIHIYPLLFTTLVKLVNKHPSDILIISNNYEKDREGIINLFETSFSSKSIADEYIKHFQFISPKYGIPAIISIYRVVILINCTATYVKEILDYSKFILYINTNPDVIKIDSIKNNLKFTTMNISENELAMSRIQTPVKEYRVPLTLADEYRKRYDEETKYINDSMRIFGDISTLDACRQGDKVRNLSAMDCRLILANNNGWTPNMDMSVYINAEIDKIFSPSAIDNRANNTYNVIRNRRELVSNYTPKIKKVIDIIKDNPCKKIIIVSKSGDFAHSVAEEINTIIPNCCGEYHNEIPKCTLPDASGNPIIYKSGANKGKEKLFGSQSLSNYFRDLYNNDYINVLSIQSAATANNLFCNCDIVIFTSTLLPNIFEFKSRFTKIKFPDEYTTIYRLYCESTIEEQVFNSEIPSNLIEICENPKKVIEIDSNTGEIVI